VKKPTVADSFDLLDTYVHLRPDGQASTVALTPSFWRDIPHNRELAKGRLMGAFQIGGSGRSNWEMHPQGDELLILVSGALDVVLDDGEQRVLSLRDQGTCIVPQGLWHQQVYRAPGMLLFITPGAGTQHRPA
jgi:mannose-6-phosphate isomerase-like protein (cupin superfamily)